MIQQWADFAFAYSPQMQLILLGVNFLTNLFTGVMITNLTLSAYGQKASVKRKLLFSFLIYIVCFFPVVLLPYVLGGSQSLSPLVLSMTTMPNPLTALACYFCGVKILKLSKYRFTHLYVIIQLYTLVLRALTRVITLLFFVQSSEPYNYFLDLLSLLASVIVHLVFYGASMVFFKRTNFGIKLTDRLFVKSIPRTLGLGFVLNSLAYALIVFFPAVWHNDPFSYVLTGLTLALCLAIVYHRMSLRAVRLELQNTKTHIGTLIRSLEEFSGLKHDFYNILHTYSGYLQLEDLPGLVRYHEQLLNTTVTAGEHLEINKKMAENPAIIALLLEKQKYARQMNVSLRFEITCQMDAIDIDTINFCRMLACLLDNAVEAAAESEERLVSVSFDQKPNGSILIVIINSTAEEVVIDEVWKTGASTKKGHGGLGLSQVRGVLSQYGNCILQVESFSQRFTVYIEISSI